MIIGGKDVEGSSGNVTEGTTRHAPEGTEDNHERPQSG
jgi:hypothetical protein